MPPKIPSIAVLDVGFFAHPDLDASRVLASRDATRLRVAPFLYGDPRAAAEHGTRTMLLAAGDGRASGLVSASPEAPVVLLKVGHGKRAPRVAIARALRWLVRNARELALGVVLLPLGDDPDEPGEPPSPVPSLVEALDRKGIVVVAAAGWDPDGACVSPASSPHVIAVAGYDLEKEAPFSGPRTEKIGGVLKPDLLAPGSPLPVPSLDGSPDRAMAGGASFSAAFVAGLAHRLLLEHPEWKRPEILKALVSRARPIPGRPPYLPPDSLETMDLFAATVDVLV
ncbi:MAG TPA: S8/S53 family peptidase [Thermoanaerobaculia bacterium]|nr:S8/S53 family peptidase [Thermoanaerobaculia bacterium]